MITLFGEEGAGLRAFRAFVCLARVNSCPFSLPLGVRGRLQLLIVALPGLYLLMFFMILLLPDYRKLIGSVCPINYKDINVCILSLLNFVSLCQATAKYSFIV